MKIGIDTEALRTFPACLSKLIDVDPRGGYFLQTDMELAIKRLSSEDTNSKMWDGWCKLNECTSDIGLKKKKCICYQGYAFSCSYQGK